VYGAFSVNHDIITRTSGVAQIHLHRVYAAF